MTVEKRKKMAGQANVVGPRLRAFRKAAGLSQKELAARCQQRGLNLTRSTLAKIESQIRFIKACELFIIARILKLPMDSFYPSDFGVNEAGTRGTRALSGIRCFPDRSGWFAARMRGLSLQESV